MLMEINGIQVTITKKTIKNMHLYVKPPDGRVEVSAPHSLSDESIKMFVRTRIGWIKKQKQQFEEQPRQTARQYISGETIYVWGRQYFLQVDYSSKRNSFQLVGDKALLTVRKESTVLQREKYVNEWYRSILKAEIERVLPKWEQITGLYCNSWQTKNMTSRWGTCIIATKKIWLNLQLAKKSLDCLDYVILHELAHLKEKKHDEKFVAIMDMYMPNWRENRKKLNGQMLDYME